MKNVEPKLELHAPADLNKLLEKIYTEVRKTDGGEYQPDSMKVMLAALDRHLKEKHALCLLLKIASF